MWETFAVVSFLCMPAFISARHDVGFQLRTEQPIKGDDTALNTVKLYCVAPGDNPNKRSSIHSKRGYWGRWGSTKWCNQGLIKSFELRSEGSQRGGDDTAANNLKVRCTGGETLEGDGNGWGGYTGWQNCPAGSAVCAIQTQVEHRQGKGDDTALNNVDLKCCRVKAPEPNCTPKDSWVTIMTCANNGGVRIKCKYTKAEGVTRGTSSSAGGGWTNEKWKSAGVSITGTFKALSATFSAEMGSRSTTSHNWQNSRHTDFHEETSTEAESDWVEPGEKLTLQQVYGWCGDYTVKTINYRSV